MCPMEITSRIVNTEQLEIGNFLWLPYRNVFYTVKRLQDYVLLYFSAKVLYITPSSFLLSVAYAA